jgi:hypothetical protein
MSARNHRQHLKQSNVAQKDDQMVVHVVQWLMNDMISPELGYVGFPPSICC